jgi:hypothetical protein
LWSDEAEAFFIVEPLNGTGLAIGHGVSPWTKLTTVREKPWPRLSAKSRKIHGDVGHRVEILSDTSNTVTPPYPFFENVPMVFAGFLQMLIAAVASTCGRFAGPLGEAAFEPWREAR